PVGRGAVVVAVDPTSLAFPLAFAARPRRDLDGHWSRFGLGSLSGVTLPADPGAHPIGLRLERFADGSRPYVEQLLRIALMPLLGEQPLQASDRHLRLL